MQSKHLSLLYGFVLKRILIGPVVRILKDISNPYPLIIIQLFCLLASATSLIYQSILFQRVFPYSLSAGRKLRQERLLFRRLRLAV